MRATYVSAAILSCLVLSAATRQAQADPDLTVRTADQMLHEAMAIPAKQIPAALLAEAQGVAIIPEVIKVGFIAGVRRGHGLVMVRDADGEWGLPQFVTLTGGSVGWQAGVQGTDVVLVFMTRKSVEGLLNGKFTIGADVAAAAGPLGRNASASTDARLKAEILSYSRSRGLFVGLSLDGSAIEIDPETQFAYYGTAPGQPPPVVPPSAAQLRQDLIELSGGPRVPVATAPAAQPAATPRQLTVLKQSLAKHATQLQSILDANWRQYLALPRELYEPTGTPPLASLQNSLAQFEKIAKDPKYQRLNERPEFEATYELLQEYCRQLSESTGTDLTLPPPPAR